MNSEKARSDSPENPFQMIFQIGVVIQNLNLRLEEDSGVSLTQWAILIRLIDMPGTSAFSLAEAVGVQPSTLTQGLKRLRRKGFIFVGTDPLDSRKKIIFLSRAGRESLLKANQEIQIWTRRLQSALPDADKTIGEMKKIFSLIGNRPRGELADGFSIHFNNGSDKL